MFKVFYAEDVCPATIELLQRCLEINLTSIPRAVPWSQNTFAISCFPLKSPDAGLSVLISIGAAEFDEREQTLIACVQELRDHWIRSAANLKSGGALYSISHYRKPGEIILDQELLQQVHIEAVSNSFKFELICQ
ncbi:E4-4 [Deer mastadenovirus B]|uniref:E4-4 n=1 Tax=Deer mastadenovirus B TaxID=2170000 RepID=A0A1Y0B6I3_9ADEN|nr:E4-4 [Deer mastadenovirus B]ART33384.1 E4-4 [Deer mastadenovirus B]